MLHYLRTLIDDLIKRTLIFVRKFSASSLTSHPTIIDAHINGCEKKRGGKEAKKFDRCVVLAWFTSYVGNPMLVRVLSSDINRERFLSRASN